MRPPKKKKKKITTSAEMGDQSKEEEEDKVDIQKKQYPGLAIPDNKERSNELLKPTKDEQVVLDTMSQVCVMEGKSG